MKYSTAKPGRIFVMRLEDGEILHEQIEKFAREKSIRAAAVMVVGGADAGSRFVVGPEKGRAKPIVPVEQVMEEAHEVTGSGTLFPDEEGNPILHMHLACGRKGSVMAGCVRKGVKVWLILEAILIELTDSTAVRALDPASGFKLLRP